MRTAIALAALLLACPATPAQVNPDSLPARDQHEGLLIAADTYQDGARSKERFGKADPAKAGILPVEVYFRNDTGETIRVNLDTIRLDIAAPGADRESLQALSADDTAQKTAHPNGTPDGGTAPRLPGPIHLPAGNKDQDKYAKTLESLALETTMVGPHQTVHGFLFFDLGHDFSLTHWASLYIPDVKVITLNKTLMYFEIPLRHEPAH